MTRQSGARNPARPVADAREEAEIEAIETLRRVMAQEKARDTGETAAFLEDVARIRSQFDSFMKRWRSPSTEVLSVPDDPGLRDELHDALRVLSRTPSALATLSLSAQARFDVLPPVSPGRRGRPKAPLTRDMAIALLKYRAGYDARGIVALLKAHGIDGDYCTPTRVSQILSAISPERLRRLRGEAGDVARTAEIREHAGDK